MKELKGTKTEKNLLEAFDAKYVYLLRAMDSPAKASMRFFSVFVPFKFCIIFMVLNG